MRVTMVKKTSAAVKTCNVFSIDFSLIFRQESMQTCAKSMKIGFVHRNRRKSTFGKPFFLKKSIFARFLESLWVSGGLPGRPGAPRWATWRPMARGPEWRASSWDAKNQEKRSSVVFLRPGPGSPYRPIGEIRPLA